MKSLSLSVHLDLLKFSTEFVAVFSKRSSDSRGRLICLIHPYYSTEKLKIQRFLMWFRNKHIFVSLNRKR